MRKLLQPLCQAIQETGHLLSTHFPRAAEDTNELPDAVIMEKAKSGTLRTEVYIHFPQFNGRKFLTAKERRKAAPISPLPTDI